MTNTSAIDAIRRNNDLVDVEVIDIINGLLKVSRRNDSSQMNRVGWIEFWTQASTCAIQKSVGKRLIQIQGKSTEQMKTYWEWTAQWPSWGASW